jgi:phytoene dehydrogenase-like protein
MEPKMRKSIIIIGAGMGGLAAGCYGQMNGYETQIFEMHSQPGGQCTSWERKGYVFDACIHHLYGCDGRSLIYQLWHELGAMPRDMVEVRECTSVRSPDGRMFVDYYNLEALEKHLIELSPKDSRIIKEYISGIKFFISHDVMSTMFGGSKWNLIKVLPSLPSLMKWMKPSMQQFAEKFSDPFLRKAFALLLYSIPEASFFLHLGRHANGITHDIQWPIGGALPFARSIEKKYIDLGGKILYRQRVEKILVECDRAVGVQLADGTQMRADIVISNADGRRTIMNMLEGKYINDQVRNYCAEPPDESVMAVNVFLGVNRDLSKEPSAMVMLLQQPVTIANHQCESLEMQIFGFDKTMAPEGKGVIKVELTSGYAYWKQLYPDKQKYKEEKEKVAAQVIELLESHFPGIKNQVEVIDVTTLATWERFMGGTHGWFNFPNRKMNFSITGASSGKNYEATLPGLSNFYMVGAWATMIGALFMNSMSGKKIINTICKQDKKKFVVVTT